MILMQEIRYCGHWVLVLCYTECWPHFNSIVSRNQCSLGVTYRMWCQLSTVCDAQWCGGQLHNTALHHAVAHNRLEMCKLLLKNGASADAQNKVNGLCVVNADPVALLCDTPPCVSGTILQLVPLAKRRTLE